MIKNEVDTRLLATDAGDQVSLSYSEKLIPFNIVPFNIFPFNIKIIQFHTYEFQQPNFQSLMRHYT